MIPTPDLSHLKQEDYLSIYEPAEDTFVLLDALEQDADEIKSLRPLICLEVGSGSGCVSGFIGSILGPYNSLFLTTDINPHASLCTLRTGRQNKIPLEPLTAHLVTPLLPRLHHSVDILIFNPPYVPTYDSEAIDAQSQGDIRGAWAGGKDGMQVTDLLLEQVDDLLSDKGRFYLVAVKQNDIAGIQARMLQTYNLLSEVVLQRRAGREHLFVIRIHR
ncbi:S-adenosyl-L-methionine-dependent methyltransferase [Panus rudis PR-1116 ss-1]|nr:S-adenosyl-L-methionine-dependent methyltransferase [Panus rudis PR-1116 ss-1]